VHALHVLRHRQRTVQYAERLQRRGGAQEGEEEAEVARAHAVALEQ
jgi:hypothetical protein